LESANALNQTSVRKIPSDTILTGTANANAAIFVNDRITNRKGDFWSYSLNVDNSSSTIVTPLTVSSLLDDGTGTILSDSASAVVSAHHRIG